MSRIDEKDREDGSRQFILKEKGRFIGLANVTSTTLGSGVQRVLLHVLDVRDGETGKGYGKHLLHAVEKWANDQGATEIIGVFGPSRVDPESVRRFYEKNGYLEDGDGYIRKSLV